MTIVQALKNLVTAFGGTSTAKTASEAIEDVATAVEASSGGLPEVSSTDNGDILKVVGGEWAKAEEKTELPSMSGVADGNVLSVDDGSAVWATPASPVVFLTFDAETYELSLTWQECMTNMQNNVLLCLITTEEGSAQLFFVSEVVVAEENEETVYRVSMFDFANGSAFSCYADSADGHPVFSD